MSAQLILDSAHPLLHFFLARCRWLLHYHPLTSPPAFPPTREDSGDGVAAHPWYPTDLDGWYRVPARPPWRSAVLYQYFDLDRQLGITRREPPVDVDARKIKTLERPLTSIGESEVWTKTWQWGVILAEEGVLPPTVDAAALSRISSRLEEIWTEARRNSP